MNRHLVLIKLGGSFATDKSKPFTANVEHIERFAKQFAKLYAKNPDVDFILGNGAGSFGHITAHAYGLRDGAQTAKQFYGMSLTHNSVRQLNGKIADALTTAGAPVFALSPADMLTYSDGEPATAQLEPITQLLAHHCTPLLHGDTILDSTRGTTIVSTEEVLFTCLKQLRAAYKKITVIYVMDANGLLDSDGNTISQFGPADVLTLRATNGRDVTGSITGKIASARKAASLADEVFLVSGHELNALQTAMTSQDSGTKIVV